MTKRTNPRVRQTLIALATVLSSATVAVFAAYVLVVGFPPSVQRTVDAVIPDLFGLGSTAMVALTPAVCVSTGVLFAVGLETAVQFSNARALRIQLEARARDDPK